MKVLHVIPSLRVGGSERQLMELLARASAGERHEVAVFDEDGPLASELARPPVFIGPLGRNPWSIARVPAVANRLRELIDRRGIDLVHAHHDTAEVVAALGTPARIPLVAERQGVGSGWIRRPALRQVMGLAHRRASVLLCNSDFVRRQALEHDRWPPDMEVVYPGVDPSRFAAEPLPPADVPAITVVANLLPVKRLDRFLRAFAMVAGRSEGVRAHLVGGGPERAHLEALALELGVQSAVSFAGPVPDPRPFVRSASVVCLTSETESFPNALLEAMSIGRPVVAVRVGGIDELVRDGVDGRLTSQHPSDIARGLLELLGDRDLLERSAANASERAEAFPIERMVQGVRDVYRRVLEEPDRGSGEDVDGGGRDAPVDEQAR